jgi:phosphatidylserine decarboxylase
MRIARQGFPYIGLLAGAGLILVLYSPTRWLSIPLFVLALFVTYFFRDPDRTPPEDPRLWVSPADGKVVYVGPERGNGGDRAQVSIFLSIFSVHINRSPLSGVITDVTYTPGRFLPAYREQASSQNEQNEMELTDGPLTVIVRTCSCRRGPRCGSRKASGSRGASRCWRRDHED